MARLNIAPTKSNLLTLRRDLSVAREGFGLLDQKREILMMELMLLLGQARDLQAELNTLQQEALDALRKAIGRSGYDCLAGAAGSTRYLHKVDVQTRIVAGVRIPRIKVTLDSIKPQFAFTGSDSGMDHVMRLFLRLLELSATLAQLETSGSLLALDLKKTQRRVNALEQVFIPNFKDTLKYVANALESKELESIFSLKLVKTRLQNDRES